MPCKSIIQVLNNTFEAHRQSQFTGVVQIGVSGATQWALNFHLGRMVWAQTLIHPIRRWHRQLVKHCPKLIETVTQQAGNPSEVPYADLSYNKLIEKVKQGEINRISMAKAVEDYLSEILFDIIHEGSLRNLHAKSPLTFTEVANRVTNTFFLSFRAGELWENTQTDWYAWQRAELMRCSPNLAPILGQTTDVQTHPSEPIYQYLARVIDGKQTFRDLAIRLNQPVLSLTKLTLPYIRQGMMGLVKVGDLGTQSEQTQLQNSLSKPQSKEQSQSQPQFQSQSQPKSVVNTSSRSPQSQSLDNGASLRQQTPAVQNVPDSKAPLIVYIDDSPMDSKIMGNILQDAGFRYFNIQEATHALPILLERKPQLIFLDLVMPVANGYEICAQVRRVSLFKDIPIVIVTSNNTLTDRVRAKLVKASGFLSKPIERNKMLKTVNKLLK